jgi:hypothetical protein
MGNATVRNLFNRTLWSDVHREREAPCGVLIFR